MNRSIQDASEEPAHEALEAFSAYLSRRALRATAVREEIVRASMRQEGHFRVEDLVEDLRQVGHTVSPATVYRALPLLIEAGIVQPAEVSGGKGYYEAVFGREQHQHLVCRKCGKVVEFEFEAFQILEREIAARHGFELTGHLHELIGICDVCRHPNDPPVRALSEKESQYHSQ